jgi:hypothetical protein
LGFRASQVLSRSRRRKEPLPLLFPLSPFKSKRLPAPCPASLRVFRPKPAGVSPRRGRRPAWRFPPTTRSHLLKRPQSADYFFLSKPSGSLRSPRNLSLHPKLSRLTGGGTFVSALRHRFSSVLPFGSRAILVDSYRNFRSSGFVPPTFAGFALFGSQAVIMFSITR